MGVVPPLGSSFKLLLSLGVHMDSEAARNVRYSALKGWDLQRQTWTDRHTRILNKGVEGRRLRFKRKNERPQADTAHTD